ncbi:MAG: CpaF family protein [Lachnospiraceae bacterium]|nr:CpaF family protein [Lachnospiraceae bacterium]
MKLHTDYEKQIIGRLDLSKDISTEEIFSSIDEEIQKISKKTAMSITERENLRTSIYHNIRELGVLQELIDDPDITEIMVNGTDGIFVEKKGKLLRVPQTFDSKEKLRQVIYRIVSDCNRVINDSSPIVDARLKDGARVNAVLDPVALNGPILTIRRFPDKPITMKDLINLGSLTEECCEFLKQEVAEGKNILVSGGTGCGKTTFLNVLSNFIPSDQRIITIEDSAELQIKNIPNIVKLETRNQNDTGCNEITIRDLIKSSLRMRPDRLIVGEVRSKETIDMLQAVNVGQSAMTTVHANSVRDVISRLETMVLMGMDIPLLAIRGQIASGINLFIHLGRLEDGSRCVFEIARPDGICDQNVVFRTIFKRTGEGLKFVEKEKTGK